MTQLQHEHIRRLIQEFGAAAYQMYEAGCDEREEAGDGNLWSLTDEALADHLMNEVLSLWVYAAALRERISKKAAASQATK
jgi:hypothetical protein